MGGPSGRKRAVRGLRGGVIALILTTATAGCGNDGSQYVGRWQLMEGGKPLTLDITHDGPWQIRSVGAPAAQPFTTVDFRDGSLIAQSSKGVITISEQPNGSLLWLGSVMIGGEPLTVALPLTKAPS